MFTILEKTYLNPFTVRMTVSAPAVAARARPGQFVILRRDERGERIPLTISSYDPAAGSVTVIFQTVGATTRSLATREAGDAILDFVGPLGRPTELDGFSHVAVIGGGLGCAIAYPQAKYLHEHHTPVDIIVGFRSSDIIILEDEMKTAADRTLILTGDGSNGHPGFVTDGLKQRLDEGAAYDLVIAIGPLPMMKAVAELTRPLGIKTVVSMNPIMIDGTGMCGGCRVTVGGEMKFACVDGPDFDGHAVDFDELMKRNRMYREQEEHACRLMEQKEKE